MTDEAYFSGYCRQIDTSRMVEVVVEDGKVTEVDCNFESCIYRKSCTIGKEILALAPQG